jgi:excisionase family DNA binding protein
MTESRIQDWIRYVQERAENVPPNEETETTAATETVQRSVPDTPRSVRSAPVIDSEPEQIVGETTSSPITPARPASAAVARAGSRIKRVAAASGRNFAPPEKSASLPAKTVSEELVAATAGSVKVETPAVRATTTSAGTTSTRGATATRLAGTLPIAGVRPTRQRVRQRPETRTQMLERLTNPTISLYEASVLLDVCSATVRRYTNSGVLPHVRTEGGQRRFRLHDVLVLMREMEAAKK